LSVHIVSAYLSAGGLGLFTFAVLGLQQGNTEHLKAFPCGEHREVDRLAEGAVVGVFHLQRASAMGAYEGLVLLFCVRNSPLVSAVHTCMAQGIGVVVGIVLGEGVGCPLDNSLGDGCRALVGLAHHLLIFRSRFHNAVGFRSRTMMVAEWWRSVPSLPLACCGWKCADRSLVLQSVDCIAPCLMLFFFGEFHDVVHSHIALHLLAYLQILLLCCVDGKGVDFIIVEAAALALLHLVENVRHDVVNAAVYCVVLLCEEFVLACTLLQIGVDGLFETFRSFHNVWCLLISYLLVIRLIIPMWYCCATS